MNAHNTRTGSWTEFLSLFPLFFDREHVRLARHGYSGVCVRFVASKRQRLRASPHAGAARNRPAGAAGPPRLDFLTESSESNVVRSRVLARVCSVARRPWRFGQRQDEKRADLRAQNGTADPPSRRPAPMGWILVGEPVEVFLTCLTPFDASGCAGSFYGTGVPLPPSGSREIGAATRAPAAVRARSKKNHRNGA